MKYIDLLKQTVSRVTLKFRPENSKVVSTYYKVSKRAILSKLRTYPRGRFQIRVAYRGGYNNTSAWYQTKKETINAINSFLDRKLLEEFLNEK